MNLDLQLDQYVKRSRVRHGSLAKSGISTGQGSDTVLISKICTYFEDQNLIKNYFWHENLSFFYWKWSSNLIKNYFCHENLSFLMKISYFENFSIGTLLLTFPLNCERSVKYAHFFAHIQTFWACLTRIIGIVSAYIYKTPCAEELLVFAYSGRP